MSEDNLNRIEVKPLIENYMDNMADSEFTISQITGHVTIKNEKEYLSKTKELQTEIIDLQEMKEDTIKNNSDDLEKKNEIDNKIKYLKDGIAEAESIMEYMFNNLNTYEEKINNIERKLAELDDYMQNMLISLQQFYNVKMNGNYELLANLIIKAEFLDVIISNNDHFNKILGTPFNYYLSNGTVKNYGTVQLHENNKKEIEKRVSKSKYQSECNNIITKYRNLASKYHLSGNYSFSGEIYYTK